mgnify:CR=1 FL=1
MKTVNIFGLFEMNNADFLISLYCLLCFSLLNLIVIFTLDWINSKRFKVNEISFDPKKDTV